MKVMRSALIFVVGAIGAQGQTKIVGGKEADIGEYPFFVEWDGCGASLIHKDIILSAAHCAEIFSDTVYVGSSRKFGTNYAGGRGLQRSITKRIPHPSYNDDKIDFDYLVMKLKTPVEDIAPILLNEDGNVPIAAQELTAIGYGLTTDFDWVGTSTLLEVGVNYIPPGKCYEGQTNGDTMLCAGTGDTKGICNGDSGGPLFIQDGDTITQVGIVSWGIKNKCGKPDAPGVYSRVSGQIDWIKTQVCNLSDDPPDYCNEGSRGPVEATAPPISSPSFVSPPTAPTSPTAPVVSPTVPSAPSSPTSSNECTDSEDTFSVDFLFENQDCKWLAENLSLYGFSCQYLDVAKVCRKTCNACQYFCA